MNLYIDKENLLSFIHSRKDNDDSYHDCERLIARQLGLIFNFSKKEILQDELILTWIKSLSEGRGFKEEEDKFTDSKFPERPVKSNCYINFNKQQLSAVYLINDEKAQSLIDKKALLVGKVGEELETLKSLFSDNDYDLDRVYDIQNNFSSWEQLDKDNHFLPCTDILIVDSYLFNSQDELLEANIYKLISLIVSEVRGKKVNIVIVTQEKLRDNYRPDYDKILRDIITLIKKQTKASPHITVIFSNIENRKHDRFILTNYKLFRSGDSFCYFDSKGNKITKGDFLDVNSLAKWRNHQLANNLIDSVQKIYDNVKKKNPNNVVAVNPKSNFIQL